MEVCFDKAGKVRVLDEEKYEQTKQLQEQTAAFSNKLEEFNSTIKTLVDVMDGQAKRIEKAKLKAIGQRNKVDSEEGSRKRKKEELRAQINEDLTDLERLREEHDSLNAVELEQRSLIEKLSNNA
eukprot:g4430.t1